MLASQAGTGQINAPRLLNPRQALLRFRPVKLLAIAAVLWNQPRRVALLKLFHRFLPELLWDNLMVDDWTDLLRYFLSAIEDARGIEMDWPTLDDVFRWGQWEASAFGILAQAIYIIPVECFGFDDEGFHGDQLEDQPAMMLLNVLLDPTEFGWPNNVQAVRKLVGKWSKREARERLDSLDVSNLPEPLCWLPELGRFAIGETGNELLDTPAGFEKWDTGWFTWGDLDKVCELYQQAKATAKRAELLNDWVAGDGLRLKQIAEVVLGRKL